MIECFFLCFENDKNMHRNIDRYQRTLRTFSIILGFMALQDYFHSF